MEGKFIVIEGIDGSGTTTHSELLKEHLEEMGWTVYITKEPTDGPLGSLLHLAFTGRLNLDTETMALLFAGDRVDHIKNDIESKLDDGVIVICDRYYLSSYAYQGIDLDLDWLKEINSKIPEPDLTLFLDVSPLVARRRLNKHRWHIELYENNSTLKKVYRKYREIIEELKDEGENIKTIDGNRPKENVKKDIIEEVNKILNVE